MTENVFYELIVILDNSLLKKKKKNGRVRLLNILIGVMNNLIKR